MSTAVGQVSQPRASCLIPTFCPVDLHPYHCPAPCHWWNWAPLLLDHIYPGGSCLEVISWQTYQYGCWGSRFLSFPQLSSSSPLPHQCVDCFGDRIQLCAFSASLTSHSSCTNRHPHLLVSTSLFEFRAALNEQMCKEKAWKSDESGLFGIQARQAGCYFQVYLARFYELILQEKKQKSHSAPSFNRWLCYL